jgi:hypothetical protein
MKPSFILIAMASAILYSSCSFLGAKKDPEPQNCTPDAAVSNLLLGKHWVTTAEITLTISGADTTSENTFAKTADCSLDDFLEFKPNNIVTADNGSDKCVYFMPQSKDGYWCTTTNGQGIAMTLGGLSGEATITFLTVQQMLWEEIKPNSPQGKTTIIRTTFEAK